MANAWITQATLSFTEFTGLMETGFLLLSWVLFQGGYPLMLLRCIMKRNKEIKKMNEE